MNMKTEYQCKSRMKHTLLIGTAMFLISPITLFAGVTAHSDAGSETGISNVTQQQQTVKGIIKGPDGLPVIAANISQKGTNNATITDLNGNFTLNVTGRQPVLVISYIGYVTTEVNVSGRAFVEVVLQEDVAALDEVVVVGYGTMRKKDVTGAVSSVRSGEITKNATSNVMQAIAGKMSGVQVVQNSGTPGGDVSILIRGVGTINDVSFVCDRWGACKRRHVVLESERCRIHRCLERCFGYGYLRFAGSQRSSDGHHQTGTGGTYGNQF